MMTRRMTRNLGLVSAVAAAGLLLGQALPALGEERSAEPDDRAFLTLSIDKEGRLLSIQRAGDTEKVPLDDACGKYETASESGFHPDIGADDGPWSPVAYCSDTISQTINALDADKLEAMSPADREALPEDLKALIDAGPADQVIQICFYVGLKKIKCFYYTIP